MIANTIDLSIVPITTLTEYANFVEAISGIVYIPFANALMESSKSKLLDEYYKGFFAESATNYKKIIEPAITKFNNINKKNLPKESVEYILKTIPIYKK